MSGLSRTPGKRVGAKHPPRVRIPPSPPKDPRAATPITQLPIIEVTTPKLVAMGKTIEARGALDGQIFRYAIA
jgi:hypothetical protein